MMSIRRVAILLLLPMTLCSVDAARAQDEATRETLYRQTVARGVRYLEAKGQSEDGSFSGFAGPGITAIATTALLKHGRTPAGPTVSRGLKYLEGMVQPDGGVYQEGSLYRNYETSLAIVCFQEANRDHRYDSLLKRAGAFVRGIQWDEGEGADSSDFSYGGAGYGKHKRPDLSNTTFLIEALQTMGAGKDDPAIQRALIFVSRCQNLESEHNTTPFSTKNPDGGFYYTAAAGGSSQAGETAHGGLRSYASMTYAGLKSMIYAGVGPEDQRVQAAFTWIQKHYDLTTNPGLGGAGLYYYYHTFAKALSAMNVDRIKGQDGQLHDWRAELVHALSERQRPDGAWVNENDRWLEGDPNLVTSYALLSLAYCRRPSP